MDSFKKFLGDLFSTVFEFLYSGGGCNATDLQFSNEMLTLSKNIWNYLAVVGLGLTIMYFLFEMNQKLALEGRDLNIKSVIAPLLKFAVAFAILSNGGKLVGGVLQFHNNFATWADSSAAAVFEVTEPATPEPGGTGGEEGTTEYTEEEAKEKVKTKISGLGMIEAVVAFLPALLMFLIQLVLSIVWKYKALVFKLEFLWKVGLTPIAFSDVYNGGNSNAIRWFKGLIATAIYGASFILIAKLGGSLAIGNVMSVIDVALSGTENILANIGNFFASYMGYLVIPFAELGVLSAVKQATREALG